MFTTFDKAIVALLVPIIIQVLVAIGVPNADQQTQFITDVVTGILTLLAVYFTPNKGTTYIDPTAKP